jgi:hypothetical protein
MSNLLKHSGPAIWNMPGDLLKASPESIQHRSGTNIGQRNSSLKYAMPVSPTERSLRRFMVRESGGSNPYTSDVLTTNPLFSRTTFSALYFAMREENNSGRDTSGCSYNILCALDNSVLQIISGIRQDINYAWEIRFY